MQKHKNRAFTLVELIVVITILAILGTIAFISLQGYSAQSRDSVRISDISSIKTALELFQLDAGKYPLATDGVDITYSGAVVWNQGTFGESTYKNVENLDKVPADPLTNSKYTYSTTATRNEYEISGVLEGDQVVLNTGLKVNAGTTEGTAIVSGTYNGQMTKTLSGTTCDVLSIPSIISNDTTTSTDVVDIVNGENFVHNGYKNLPSSFKSSKFDVVGGFAFTPNKLVSYTDTGSCTALTDKTDVTARVQLLKGLQDSYSGTILKNDLKLSRLLALEIDTNAPSIEAQNYAGGFVNNSLGGEVVIVSSGGESSNSGPILKNVLDCGITSGYVVYGTEDGGSGSLVCGNDIIVCNGTTGSGITISACNVGSSTIGTGSLAYGKYYQFGKNISFGDGSWTNGVVGNGYDWKAPGGTNSGSANDWGVLDDDKDTITFSTSTLDNQLKMKGPCSIGYHVPTNKEWINLYGLKSWNGGLEMKNLLMLPYTGRLNYSDGGLVLEENSGYYWSSSPHWSNEYNLLINDGSINPSQNFYRANGYNIRCFKN